MILSQLDFTTTTTSLTIFKKNRIEMIDLVTQLLHVPEGFFSAMIVSFLLILVSEFCDKSFMIIAYQAMQHSRFLVFNAALVSDIGHYLLKNSKKK